MLDNYIGGSVNVWAKFDTGMNRLGFDPEHSGSVLKRLVASRGVNDMRVMTHLASADELENPSTMEQLDAFEPVVRDFDGDVSIGNSPATLGWPETVSARTRFGFSGDNWIRPGIALFGISPFADRTGTDLGLEPGDAIRISFDRHQAPEGGRQGRLQGCLCERRRYDARDHCGGVR